MKRRALAFAVGIVVVPALLVPVEAASFYSANADNGSILSSGERRGYVLYVPPSYSAARPTPLVISLHPAALWGAAQRYASRWNVKADRDGFIVVYPTASSESGVRVWHAERDSRLARDVRFIADLIDTLSARYNVDRARIYANGFSNGGGMSFVLSCLMPDRIAAVGLVAQAELLPFEWCTDRHAVPMIAFHGTRDPATPYDGGASWVTERPFPSIPGFTEKWARRNGCAPIAVDTAIAADVTRRSYPNCARDAGVELYTVRGGGHTWPGGGALPEWFVGPTSRSLDATEIMWQFFRAHPLR